MYYWEIVTEQVGTRVSASNLESSSIEELSFWKEKNPDPCLCSTDRYIIRDVPGWLYDQRYCAVCDRFLGLI